ncbi:MAG: DUF1329 domain-containing protein [Nevskiaceae bacterium]|nr:MAG: DUF1329 domain-containing protein [Nevskiaceae bacterium]TBR72655.1 MAG: DUF1329 domain-containing protein [Nevskiaceae bacterium]
MKKRLFTCMAAAALSSMALTPVLAATYTPADVKASFDPYAQGMPSFKGLTVGMTINQSNVDQFKAVLAPVVYNVIKNGWNTITVGPTQDIKLTQGYIKATLDNLNKTSLAKDSDNLIGYVAGRPFPGEPDPKDPRAGTKIAWNFQHGLSWGDNGTIDPFVMKYIDMNTGKVQRTLQLEYHTLNLMHRVDYAPIPEFLPNPAEIFRTIYIKVRSPSDLRNTQLLIQRYDDDSKPDTSYIYLGFQRRVRRLAPGQTTDAFLGSDLMIQDFEGFNDRISAMNWKYLGTKDILYPFYAHTELKNLDPADYPGLKEGFKFTSLGGKADCFPQVTWQLRKVYVLEATPVDKSSPIGKRIIYQDAQTTKMSITGIYDRKGKLWKAWLISNSDPDHHLPSNKGSGIEIDDGFTMVDMQAMHCSIGRFQGQINPKLSPKDMFSEQYMRNTGTGN